MKKSKVNETVEEIEESTPAKVIDETAQAASDEKQPGGEQITEPKRMSIFDMMSGMEEVLKLHDRIRLIQKLAINRTMQNDGNLFESLQRYCERLQEYVTAMEAVDKAHLKDGETINYEVEKANMDAKEKSMEFLSNILGGGMRGFGQRRPAVMFGGMGGGFGINEPSGSIFDIISDGDMRGFGQRRPAGNSGDLDDLLGALTDIFSHIGDDENKDDDEDDYSGIDELNDDDDFIEDTSEVAF